MAPTQNRFRTVLLGCLLATAGCLLSFLSRSNQATHDTFQLPEVLGSWEAQETEQLAPSETAMLQAHDHWRRSYRCRETGRRVIVTLVAGASGPLVGHQPEVCYARNEYCSHSTPQRWTVPDHLDQFRFQTFEPRQVESPAMTVCYAWHDGEQWRAPRFPRLRLAGRYSLQRLQLGMQHPSGYSQQARAAMQQFLMLTVDTTHKHSLRMAALPRPANQTMRP